MDIAYWGSRQDGCTAKVIGALRYMRGLFLNLLLSLSEYYNEPVNSYHDVPIVWIKSKDLVVVF